MKKSGFTLLELLVVMGIMGLLGTVATAGYFAAVNGMAVRGARQAVSSVIQTAQHAASANHSVTGVYFYNQLLQESSVKHNGSVVGVAVAVKASGRLSGVINTGGKFLVDEFGDIESGRPIYDSQARDQDKNTRDNQAGESRLYLLDLGGREVYYSTVYDYVERVSKRSGGRIFEEMLTAGGVTNLLKYAFKVKTGTSGTADSKWHAGALYGSELASVQLPRNMIFGSRIPLTLQQSIIENPVDAIFFKPDGSASGSTQVRISQCRTGGADGQLAVTSSFNSIDIDKDVK